MARWDDVKKKGGRKCHTISSIWNSIIITPKYLEIENDSEKGGIALEIKS